MSCREEVIRTQLINISRNSALGLDCVDQHHMIVSQKRLQKGEAPITCLGNGNSRMRDPLAHLCSHPIAHPVITEDSISYP